MSLLDEAKQASKTNKPTCTIAALDDDLREQVNAALAEPDVSATGLSRALAKRGLRVQAPTLRRHGRGDCTCDVG